MDVSTVAALRPPRPVAGRRSLAIISLAALAAIGFFVSVALPYLALDPRVLTRYGPRVPWVLVHVAGGAIALLTGPVQLWLGINRRAMRVHRRLGIAYVASVGISSVAAFYLAAHTTLGWGFASGITGLGIAWIVTTTLAVAAIRRGLIEQHRDWMIRSYVVTFAFVTFRAAWLALQAAGVGTRDEPLAMSSWFCWAAPLLVVETIQHGRRFRGAAARRGRDRIDRARHRAGIGRRAGAIDGGRSARPGQRRFGERPSRCRGRHRQYRDKRRPLARDRWAGRVPCARPASGHLPRDVDRLAFATETREGSCCCSTIIVARFTMKIAAAQEAVTVVAETISRPGHTAVPIAETAAGGKPADRRPQLLSFR
jgi:uncharacterized membrane protein